MAVLHRFILCFSLILLTIVGMLNSVRHQAPLEMIAFTCCHDYSSPKLYSISTDGKKLKLINTNPVFNQYYLDWSPNGQWLAGIALATEYNDPDLFYIRWNGNNFSIGNDMGSANYPSWSPDSQLIAFILEFEQHIVIKKWNTPDTLSWDTFGNEVYSSDIIYWDASFAVDSIYSLHWLNENEIVFLAVHEYGTWENYYQDGISQAYRLSLDNLSVRPLTDSIYLTPTNPKWSPDGQWLVFEEVTDEYNIQVAKMRPDGSDYQVLTRGNRNHFPAWSSDGKWIAFTSDRETLGQFKLYKIRSDGSDVQKLSNLTMVSYPTWSPKFDMLWHRNELAGLALGLIAGISVLRLMTSR
jgi:Tol biopolymer transport system component